MRGFFLVAFGLVALDVLLRSPAQRFGVVVSTPTRWLAQWMDPHTPLIADKAPAAPANDGSGLPGGWGSGKPEPIYIKPQNGTCPKGYSLVKGTCMRDVPQVSAM